MSGQRDIEPRRAPLLDRLTLTSHTPEMEVGKPVFVGGILFNEGKNFLVIANENNQLRTEQYDTNKHKNGLAAIQETGRVITLNTFSNVVTRQVVLDPIDFRRPERSIDKHAPFALHFNVNNPENGESEKLWVGEEEILDIFTGRQGGIALFSGKGFPDETGLLFERTTDGNKTATLLFMHPESPDIQGNNSVDGLNFFLNQINTILASDTDITLQTQALEAVRNYENHGKIDFLSNDVRREIFRLQVIALARSTAKGKANFFGDLSEIVPKIGKKVLKDRVPRDYQETVDRKVDTVIVDFTRPLMSEDPSTRTKINSAGRNKQKEKLIVRIDDIIQTEQGMSLLTTFKNAMSSSRYDTTDIVINRVDKWIATAETLQELADITELISYMFKRYRSSSRYYVWYEKSKAEGSQKEKPGDVNGEELRLHMLDKLSTRRAELTS